MNISHNTTYKKGNLKTKKGATNSISSAESPSHQTRAVTRAKDTTIHSKSIINPSHAILYPLIHFQDSKTMAPHYIDYILYV